METKKASVHLIQSTPNALYAMCYFRHVMGSKMPDSLNEFMKDPSQYLGCTIDKYFETMLLHDGMPSFLEVIGTTWKLEHVSRALTHQLVRHRIGFTFSQQSMRCVRAEKFAEEGNYYLPETVKNPETYHAGMKMIQNIYQISLDDGVCTQDARGLLPTNVHTTICFHANLRALIEMVNKRLCWGVQGEFQSVACQIRNLVIARIDHRLGKYFGAPCDTKGTCMMEGDNLKKIKEGKLEGNQNTERACPKYIEQFV